MVAASYNVTTSNLIICIYLIKIYYKYISRRFEDYLEIYLYYLYFSGNTVQNNQYKYQLKTATTFSIPTIHLIKDIYLYDRHFLP